MIGLADYAGNNAGTMGMILRKVMRSAVLVAVLAALLPVGAGDARAGGSRAKGGAMKCQMPQKAAIRINPVTSEIVYDYSRSSAQIDQIARQIGTTASQRPRGKDSTTGGLRVDTPVVKSEIGWGYETELINNKPTRVCLWYTEVNVEIKLSPVIYVSNDHRPGTVCHDEILAHERRHVQVDREVMNKFAADIGRDIQLAVEKTGTWGPFPASQRDALGKQMMERISTVIRAHEAAMQTTMAARQAVVDSPQEYKRLSTICNAEKIQQQRR